jgi:hypothetical protein
MKCTSITCQTIHRTACRIASTATTAPLEVLLYIWVQVVLYLETLSAFIQVKCIVPVLERGFVLKSALSELSMEVECSEMSLLMVYTVNSGSSSVVKGNDAITSARYFKYFASI